MSTATKSQAGQESNAPLLDREKYGRTNSAHALWKIGLAAVPAVPALRAALKDSEKGVRQYAALTF
jgi:HEAT repeat protein